MIPYEELVAALANWRARQGLGPAPTRARAPMPPPAPSRQQASAYAAPPPAAYEAPLASADYGNDDGTAVHEPSTSEIDVDAEGLDVLDEQPS